MNKSATLAITALTVHCFGLIALNRRIEPFMYNFYLISWWSYILFVDALVSLKDRRFLIANRRLLYLVVVSSAFWCIFELVNLRIENWAYINVPATRSIRVLGYLLAFGTVIPGIYVTKEAVQRCLGEVRIKPLHLSRLRSPAFLVSGLVLLLPVLFYPDIFFPLTWAFLIPITESINYRRGNASFIRELEQGRAGGIAATLLSGMICGFFWELWNYWAITKWIYTVPFFDGFKLFEMPVLGYLGFAFFAVETISFFNLFSGATVFRKMGLGAGILCLLFSVGVFSMIDGNTVFSHLAGVDQLQFLSAEKRERIEKQGVGSSYGIDRSMLSPAERNFIDLIQLKGLGFDHALQLGERGIVNVASLARLSPAEMCAIIHETQIRRCGVYIRAARTR